MCKFIQARHLSSKHPINLQIKEKFIKLLNLILKNKTNKKIFAKLYFQMIKYYKI